MMGRTVVSFLGWGKQAVKPPKLIAKTWGSPAKWSDDVPPFESLFLRAGRTIMLAWLFRNEMLLLKLAAYPTSQQLS